MKRGATSQMDGWISTTIEDGLGVHVRVGLNPSGELVITDLFVTGAEITTDVLRRINPNRLLAGVVVDRSAIDQALAVMPRADLAAPFAEAARAIDSGEEVPSAVFSHGWLTGLLAAHATPDDGTTLGDLRSRATGKLGPARRKSLGRPTGQRGDDAFYKRVAEAYRSAAAESGRPAVVLAEENDVPVETVRRWVKEARRRGLLGAGRKGRAI